MDQTELIQFWYTVTFEIEEAASSGIVHCGNFDNFNLYKKDAFIRSSLVKAVYSLARIIAFLVVSGEAS